MTPEFKLMAVIDECKAALEKYREVPLYKVVGIDTARGFDEPITEPEYEAYNTLTSINEKLEKLNETKTYT